MLHLAKAVDRARVDPHVVITRDNTSTAMLVDMASYASSITFFPASSSPSPGSVTRDPEAFEALVQYLSGFDVIWSAYSGGADDLVGLDAAARAGVPVAVCYVGWVLTVPPHLPIDALELPSDALRAVQLADHYHVARINSPLDLTLFDPRTSNTTDRAGRPVVVIGRLSRLVAEKNPHAFILIASEVRRRWTGTAQVRFVLAGDGPLLGELERFAEEHGVASWVEFRGAVAPELVPGLLATWDIFLYPSFGDSYGYVVAEAMAMALPVVATAVGSLPELVDHGRTGFLVSPRMTSCDEHDTSTCAEEVSAPE